jgi:hypothetical protein
MQMILLFLIGTNMSFIEKDLTDELHSFSQWLIDLHLGKRETMLFGSKHRLKTCASVKL